MMPIDPKRLARDAKRAQDARAPVAIGRETTGVTRAVRTALPVLQALRKAGVTWAAIAQAMSAQGITQGKGAPLTATRLTAIVSQVEAGARRLAVKETARCRRADLSAGGEIELSSATAKVGALESPGVTPTAPAPRSEEQLRRDGLDQLKEILGRTSS